MAFAKPHTWADGKVRTVRAHAFHSRRGEHKHVLSGGLPFRVTQVPTLEMIGDWNLSWSWLCPRSTTNNFFFNSLTRLARASRSAMATHVYISKHAANIRLDAVRRKAALPSGEKATDGAASFCIRPQLCIASKSSFSPNSDSSGARPSRNPPSFPEHGARSQSKSSSQLSGSFFLGTSIPHSLPDDADMRCIRVGLEAQRQRGVLSQHVNRMQISTNPHAD